VQFRNVNYFIRGLSWLAFATFFLVVQIASSSGLEWFGWLLVGGPLVLGAVLLRRWRRTFLRTTAEGIRLHRHSDDRLYPWSAIDRFVIVPPSERTPFFYWRNPTRFMLRHRMRRDMATMVLRDGTLVPVHAIQPYHGFSRFRDFDLAMTGPADQAVASLNRRVAAEHAAAAGTEPPVRGA
jgi:hypothetical protein